MRHPREDPAIASSVLLSLYNELSELRDLFVRGMRIFGISEEALRDIHGQISLRAFVGIFEWLATEIGDPCLGLRASQRAGPAALGAVGYLFLSSGNLENALQGLVCHIKAIQKSSDMAIEYFDGYVRVRYQIADDTIAPRQQDAEYSLGLTWHYMKLLSKSNCRLIQVSFEHENIRKSAALHRRVFNAPVLFGQSTNAISISMHEFRQWHDGYDPHLIPILEEHIANSMDADAVPDTFAKTVQQLLTESVLRQGARAELVAGLLKIAPVTLHRRLGKDGVRFKALVDQRSMAIARRLLRHGKSPIADISQRLGFSDPASFSRACRRWFGRTPREYRNSIE